MDWTAARRPCSPAPPGRYSCAHETRLRFLPPGCPRLRARRRRRPRVVPSHAALASAAGLASLPAWPSPPPWPSPPRWRWPRRRPRRRAADLRRPHPLQPRRGRPAAAGRGDRDAAQGRHPARAGVELGRRRHAEAAGAGAGPDPAVAAAVPLARRDRHLGARRVGGRVPGGAARRVALRALGEFHVYGADADLPVVRKAVALARKHSLVLHAHSDADAIERLFRQYPDARILWAHSGFERPAASPRC